jgi:surfactin synthase thioesterase subunit
MQSPTPWFLSLRPLSAPRLRVFCFPHAGGSGSAFTSWARPFADAGIELIAIQYPGRESRLGEHPVTQVEAISRPVAREIQVRVGDTPFVLLGHSMGATIAFEALLELQRSNQARPLRLFISGRRPPHLTVKPRFIDATDENAVIAHVSERYGGIHPEVLGHPEMRSLVARVLGADLSLLRNYDYRGDLPSTAVPFTIMGGREDATVDETMLQQWERYTSGECTTTMLAGDHFFIFRDPLSILSLVRTKLLIAS